MILSFSKIEIHNHLLEKNYILPRVVTVDNIIRVFQYILLNNILFLNKMFKFRIVSRSLCLSCNSEEETPFHIFHGCTHTRNVWNQLQACISENLVFPCLTLHVWLYRYPTVKSCYYKSPATYI